jgi:serine phosphatase RsbU (regulator of sigma subunit)
MKYLLNTLILFIFISLIGNAQQAAYPVINYTTKDYGRDFHPANTAIVQDLRGIIYVANGFKLLEYDGTKWSSYPNGKGTWILSLAIDSSGIVYAGSQNEFGMFVPDNRGKLTYRSLSDSLDLQKTDIKNVWKAYAFSGGVVFQTEEYLFICRNGKTEIIKPETSFHTSFVINDILYLRQRGNGLMQLKDHNLIKVKGGEIFDTTGIFTMLPFGKSNKKILIGTRDKGFWIFEPDNHTLPFRNFTIKDQDILEKAVITGGVLTADRSFAIGTMLNGLIVIDTAGNTKTIINKSRGLQDNEVKQPVLDRNQNIWLALNNGISRVEISSPLSLLNENSGITGSINSIIRYNNQLWVGSTTGLFVQSSGKEGEPPFKQAFSITVPVWSLIKAEGSLLAGTDEGIYRVTDATTKKISSGESISLAYSPEMKLLLAGGPKGLTAYSYNGSFNRVKSPGIEGEDILGIKGLYNSAESSEVFWIGTRYNGVIRFKVLKDFSFTSDYYNNADGLPDGTITPYYFNSGIIFGTMQGLFGFTDENKIKESLPDSLKNNNKFNKGYFSELPDINDSLGRAVTFLTETGSKIWLCSDNSAGYLDKENNMAYVNRPFMGIDVGKINIIYPDEKGICWIGSTDGLIRYDETMSKDYKKNYFSLIRKVTFLNNDSAIFLGTNFADENGSLKIIPEQPSDIRPDIRYRDNSVRFEFSAPFYEYPGKIYYSYKLGDSNSKWSQWTVENFREYTNLHEGEYTFRVKARNVYGTESKPAQYSFVVLPPWYRSSIAYILYIILAVILFWLVARIYSYRLKRENIVLEGIVADRTAEVVRQKDEIVIKNTVLEYQKKEIEDSIRYARRIQSAVIPSEKDCINLLTDAFVLFRPLNIVSGDFYWISHAERKIVFTAADCTGHGVPGAFMSMLGVAFLNEIVNKDNITEPDLILNQLRAKVIQALQQQGISGEARDGMDIAIVTIDKTENKLAYSGAYNPLIMIRNGEIFETAGDKMPIGIYDFMSPFNRHEINIEKGDVFYMSSDGYEDQFGGPDGKKFKAKQFKQLLLEIHNQPMETQKEILEKRFEEWKGELPQVDDVVVIGLKIGGDI